ncbi:hypothetical protein, partial [Faecalibaculum rodentium]|uniref:hypothetical protein n=1 Tax=Faecalibaculum rodentium TaxID=1702221 RepID=UPI0023EF88A2
GGRKVHENICTNRPVPNGTLGGVRGSDDTYSIQLQALSRDGTQTHRKREFKTLILIKDTFL